MASVSKRQWTHNGVTKEAWTVRYKDRGGAHRSKAFELKKQADEFRKKVERELDDGTHIARRDSRTVGGLIDEYLEHMTRRASEGQVSLPHVGSLKRALLPARAHMGALIVADIKWQDVEKYGILLRQQKCLHFDRKFSNGTIASALSVFSRMMNYAVRRGYAVRNVVPDARAELGTMPQRKIETFSQIEMQALVAAALERPHRRARRPHAMMLTVLYLGAMCGMRRGEILGLRWEAIDFSAMTIAITKSLTDLDELKGPKTKAGIRTIPMPDVVAESLRLWRPFVVEDDRGLIFRTVNAKPFSGMNFYNGYWYPLLRRAGMPGSKGAHRHFHATRHFAGSHWLALGVPLPEVSRLLGHANMAITAEIYSHAVAEVHHQASAMNRCADLLSPRPVAQGLRIAA
jgi:integrase